MESVKRYKISKDQLERVVENFVMESANIASKKAPVKNLIPTQGAEAKKHVKNKMSGKMVEKGEGVPAAGAMKKKLPQASDAKKFVSKSKASHSTKAKVVKESDLFKGVLTEDIMSNLDTVCEGLGIATGTVSVGGDSVSKCFMALMAIATGGGIGLGILKTFGKDALEGVKNFFSKKKDKTDNMTDFMDYSSLTKDEIKTKLQSTIKANPELQKQLQIAKKYGK